MPGSLLPVRSTMAPGDTVKFTSRSLRGDDDADYYSNMLAAQKCCSTRSSTARPPRLPPALRCSRGRAVTLYWDDTPETAKDPATGEQDFEGYKIYRSEDGGMTWGDGTTDALGTTYGYVPVAQFDLANNIKGPDPKNPLMWLGTDSGSAAQLGGQQCGRRHCLFVYDCFLRQGHRKLYRSRRRGRRPSGESFRHRHPLAACPGKDAARLRG